MRSQLEEMCRIYAGLQTLETWPDELQYEPLLNRALDIRSSFMQYLAVQIKHANTPLGKVGMLCFIMPANFLGRVAKVFATGSESLTDATTDVKIAVDNYTRELQSTHANLTVEVWKKVRGILCSSEIMRADCHRYGPAAWMYLLQYPISCIFRSRRPSTGTSTR